MMRHVIPAVEALGADERGAVLGLLVGGCVGGGFSAAARLSGPAGARCRAALEACRGDGAGPAGARAALAAEVGAPLPAGLDRVHPGWLRRALEREPSVLVRAVARGLAPEVGRVADELLRARGESGRGADAIPEGPGLDGLRRALFAHLAPLPAPDGPGLPVARALCALSAAALLDELERRGAATLGLALGGAPGDVVARAAAGVGEPLARVLVDAARGGGGAGARDEAPRLVAAVSAGARDEARRLVAAVSAGELVGGPARAVGLRAVAAALAAEGAAAVAAVAQRLPPALGEALVSRAARGGP
jgi:hypothetical protein